MWYTFRGQVNGVGGADKIVIGKIGGVTLGAVIDEDLESRCEALALALPDQEHRTRGDDQGTLLQLTPAFAMRTVGDGHHGFAQTHVVGKHAAEPGSGQGAHPGDSIVLIITQGAAKSPGQAQSLQRTVGQGLERSRRLFQALEVLSL